jgi:chemotaxis signal transduction protein
MRTFVFFRTATGNYALPVESTVGVRLASGVVPLPSPRPNVVGMLPGDPPIVVVSPLGGGAAQVILLEVHGIAYGLLVEQVTGLARVDESDIGPPPAGQDEELVSGVLDHDDGLVLLADPAALAGRL